MKRIIISIWLVVLGVGLLPTGAQTKWMNPLEQGENIVHGRWWNSELKDNYHRLTPRAEGKVRGAVWGLSQQSAGLSVCFHTNAPSVKVRYKVSGGLNMFHMPTTGVSGLDLYATDADGQLRWCASRFNLSFKDTINYEFKDLTYFTGKEHGYDFELFLPLYNEVKWLEVGVPEDCELRFIPAPKEQPIVVYGTSIAQGACASRTGMAWTNIVHRESGLPVINLGFSGNALMEEEVFGFLAEIDARLFIIDCLPNMSTERTELIYDRLLKGVEILRKKSDAPILLVDHNYANGTSSQQAVDWYSHSNEQQQRAYMTLKEQGVKNLYYLDHMELGFTQESMVEGVHPNDLGMRQYADAYLKKIQKILGAPASARQPAKPDKVNKVNLFMGTANDYGQMTPGATVPYSQIQVCPDSKPRQHPGYDYEVPTISGFSINRLSGVGGSGCGGNVSLMPDATGEGVQLLKPTERAVPGFYSVLLNNGVEFAATADHRMAVERFSFPAASKPVLLLNPRSAFDKLFDAGFEQKTTTMGQGFAVCANTCGRGRYHLHYRLYTSAPFVLDTISDGRKRLTFALDPQPSALDPRHSTIEVRIVVSTGLADELEKMPEQSVWQTDFQTLAERAQGEWERLLSTVEVEGGTADQQTIFYTSLYRTFHSPFQVTDRYMRHYLGTDGNRHEVKEGTYYSSWSLWDTYRTKFPLITLLDASRSSDIMQSLSQLYITGKKDWSTDKECVPTVRTEHAIATLLDAYRQGISIPSLRDAYPGMVAEVKRLSLKSPDQCLEASGDFWALGQLAKELGMKEDATRWTKRGEEIFDSIWPREFQHIDKESFTKMKGNGLYQGTRWQYRWGAPMYLPQMIKRVGKKQLGEQLQTFFSEELYNQGNEPDIHVPFLFGRLGMPEKTGAIVRSLATESITHRYGGNDAYPTPFVGCAFVNQPRGYCPEMDEDDGAMSAWYVFASIGMYPLVVGEAVLELFPPLFDKVTLHLGADQKTTIIVRVEGRESRVESRESRVKRVTWNGKRLSNYQIPVNELKKGGELVFHY